MAEDVITDEVLWGAHRVRTIAHSLFDLEHQYINCRTAKERDSLRCILLERLEAEGDELARWAERLHAQVRPGARGDTLRSTGKGKVPTNGTG